MKKDEAEQIKIAQWFNHRYKSIGIKYLRPVVAYELFLTLLQTKEQNKILDIACGPGQLLLQAKKNNLQCFGIDISEEAILLCKKRLPDATVIVANAEQIPFENNTFNYISCIGSLERFVNRNTALQEMKRVAKTDATFCFMVRNSNNSSWKFFKQYFKLQNKTGHQDAMNLNEWTSLFKQNNFDIQLITHDHWPLLRWKRWLSAGLLKIDYGKFQSAKKDITTSNEFIFILKNASNC